MARTITRSAFMVLSLASLGCIIFFLGVQSKLDSDPQCGSFLQIRNKFFSGQIAEQDSKTIQILNRLKTKSESCYNILKPESKLSKNSTWVKFEIGGNLEKRTVHIYSAYYDARTIGRDLPNIRLLGTSSADLTQNKLFCQFWYPNLQRPFIAPVTQDLLQNNEKMKQYVFSCELFSSEPKPTHVSLTAGTKCSNATNAIKINVPVRQKPIYDIGLCVLDSHHRDIEEHPYWLIEWVELYRLLGVKHVTFYNTSSLPVKVHGVIEGYVLAGNADLYPMSSPYADALALSNRDHGLSSIILNDCLLRNQYQYQYTIASGFSDIIMPQSTHAYSEIIKIYFNRKRHKDIVPLLSFDKRYFSVAKTDEDDLKKGLWIENRREFTPQKVDGQYQSLLVNLDFCIYVKGWVCMVEAGREELTTGGQALIPHNGAHAEGRVVSDHAYFMKCQDWNHPSCRGSGSEVTNPGRADRDSGYHNSDTFKEMMARLRIRVKSRHDIIRLDYDW